MDVLLDTIGVTLARGYMAYGIAVLLLSTIFFLHLVLLGAIGYGTWARMQGRRAWPWLPNSVRGAGRVIVELVYGFANPLIYLTVLTQSLPMLAPRGGWWDRALITLAWTCFVLLWGVRLLGGSLGRWIDGEAPRARRGVRVLLVVSLACLALFAIRDASLALQGHVYLPDAGVIASLGLRVAPLYLIPAVLLIDYLWATMGRRAETAGARRQPRDLWPAFFLTSTRVARVGIAGAASIALLTVGLGAYRRSDAIVRHLVSTHRDAIARRAAQYDVDPRLIGAIVYVTHRDQLSPFRDAIERLAMSAWAEDGTSDVMLDRPFDLSVGVAQIKPRTAQTAGMLSRGLSHDGLAQGAVYWYRGTERFDMSWPQTLPADLRARLEPPFAVPAAKDVVVRALLDDDENLATCALILALYQAQWEAANPSWSLRGRPEILATLYQIGFARSTPHAAPRSNDFGRRVLEVYHQPWLAALFAMPSEGGGRARTAGLEQAADPVGGAVRHIARPRTRIALAECGGNAVMSPTVRRGRILHVNVEPESREPLYRQIYRQVRRAILDGLLHAGHPLPSSRTLARDLRVSRATVIQAYEQLATEGFIKGKAGAATTVAAPIRGAILRPGMAASAAVTANAVKSSPHLSDRGHAIERLPLDAFQGICETPRAFRTGVPALDLFPTDVWGRLLARRWRSSSPRNLGYGDACGFGPLREAIAEYLRSARGVRCNADQILVCGGSQQAIDLTLRILVDPGDRAWTEDPGYPGVRNSLQVHGAQAVAVPVDREGIDVAQGIQLAPHARLAIVTPARHVPLGVALSLPRRLALLQWAASTGAWIVEDDYDSEFRYTSTPLSALQGLDDHGLVIHIGTFSKLMFPSLRLGYIVMPPALHEAFRKARFTAGFCSPYLEQAAMADFMLEGHFERHIRRMRMLYQSRQHLLVSQLHRHLGATLDVSSSDAGMNVLAWLRHGISDRRAAQAAQRHGIDLLPVSAFSVVARAPSGLILGFAGVREPEIREGVRTLAKALRGVAAS